MSIVKIECLRCGRKFKSDDDFDKHQTPMGACRSDEAMIKRDMVKTRRGFWITPLSAGKPK